QAGFKKKMAPTTAEAKLKARASTPRMTATQQREFGSQILIARQNSVADEFYLLAALSDVLAKSDAVRLHLAELQGASRSLRPFRLAVLREIAPPSFSGFCVLVIALKQECEIEHRIRVVWGSFQSSAQAIDRGF